MPLRKIPAGEPPKALDAFYVTRLQKERHVEQGSAEAAEYVRFDARALRTSRTHEAVVMHPLPRTTELAYELDADPRAVYFEQAAAGVPVRMASDRVDDGEAAAASAVARPGAPSRFASNREPPPRCTNPNCITRFEGAYLAPRFRSRAQHRFVRARAEMRLLRARTADRIRRSRDDRIATIATTKTSPSYVRQWIEEGSLAVFDSVKQAEEGGYEPYKRGPQREIMNADEVERAVESLADQMIADVADMSAVSIVGVVSRGAMLALRLRDLIGSKTGVLPPCAALDVYSRRCASSDRRRRNFSPSKTASSCWSTTCSTADGRCSARWR